MLYYPFKRKPHKIVKHTQTICQLLPTICLTVFDRLWRWRLKNYNKIFITVLSHCKFEHKNLGPWLFCFIKTRTESVDSRQWWLLTFSVHVNSKAVIHTVFIKSSKSFAKLTGKHLCRNLFDEVIAYCLHFLKRLRDRCIFVNLSVFFITGFLQNTWERLLPYYILRFLIKQKEHLTTHFSSLKITKVILTVSTFWQVKFEVQVASALIQCLENKFAFKGNLQIYFSITISNNLIVEVRITCIYF